MPTPVSGESWREFIARCLSDSEAVQDFPETDQRFAFCYAQWQAKPEEENGID